jgi:hypothetical protein
MSKLLENLFKISEIMQSIEDFISIKMRIESLDQNDPNYITLVEQTDLLVAVLIAFSKKPKVNEGDRK